MNEIFYLAIFGLICGTIFLLGGLGFAIWWIVNHVQIV